MAPNVWDSTTTSTSNWGYTVSTTAAYGAEPTRYSEDTSSRWDVVYVITGHSKEIETKIKKLLKKMVAEMCKSGWVNYEPYYSDPKPIPVNLRGVRLEGRGWGNKNKS